MKYLVGFVVGVFSVLLVLYLLFAQHNGFFTPAGPEDYAPPGQSPYTPVGFRFTGPYTDDDSHVQLQLGVSLFRLEPVLQLDPNGARSVCFSAASGRSAAAQSRLSLAIQLFENDQQVLLAALTRAEQTNTPMLKLIDGVDEAASILVSPGAANAYQQALQATPTPFDLVLTAEEYQIDALVGIARNLQGHRPVGPCSPDTDLTEIQGWSDLMVKHWGDKATDFDWNAYEKTGTPPG